MRREQEGRRKTKGEKTKAKGRGESRSLIPTWCVQCVWISSSVMRRGECMRALVAQSTCVLFAVKDERNRGVRKQGEKRHQERRKTDFSHY